MNSISQTLSLLRDLALEFRYRSATRRMIDERLANYWRAERSLELDACIARLSDYASARHQTRPLSKGDVDLAEQKSLLANAALQQALAAAHRLPGRFSEIVEKIRRIASFDIKDEAAFQIYLDFKRLLYSEVTTLIEAKHPQTAVLHISCHPRLHRAQASAHSFEGAGIDHSVDVIVYGRPQDEPHATLHPNGSILVSLPTKDEYENLGGKVVQALGLLALVPSIKAAVKVDDDHRAKDFEILSRFLKDAAKQTHPTIWGDGYRPPHLGGHHRGWHLGKTQRESQLEQPFEFPSPAIWARGGAAYLINKPALGSILWSEVYLQSFVQGSLYEDVLMSDMILRSGGSIRTIQIAEGIHAPAPY